MERTQDRRCLATKRAMGKSMNKQGEFDAPFQPLFDGVTGIIDSARPSAARSVDAAEAAAYWLAERYVVEFERRGNGRADCGGSIVEQRLADAPSVRCGRGFRLRSVWPMKAFCPARPILQTVSAESSLIGIASRFPLPWSAYARLSSVKNPRAREFYEEESLQGGCSVRQLDRRIDSRFYERAALSKN